MGRLGLKRSRYTVQLPRTPAQSPDTRRPEQCTASVPAAQRRGRLEGACVLYS